MWSTKMPGLLCLKVNVRMLVDLWWLQALSGLKRFEVLTMFIFNCS